MVRCVVSPSSLLLPSYTPGHFRDNELPKGGRLLHCILTPMAELRIYHQRIVPSIAPTQQGHHRLVAVELSPGFQMFRSHKAGSLVRGYKS